MVDDFYPAIIVTPLDSDYRRKRSGGGRARTFADIEQTQEDMLNSCSLIKSDLKKGGQGNQTIGIARLKLRDEALAKSHRPVETFTWETCPVIGDLDEAGELLVLVSPERIDRLSKRIRNLGRDGCAHLTSVEAFTLVGNDRRFPQRVQSAVRDMIQLEGHARLKLRIPGFHILADLFREELNAQKVLLTEMRVEQSPYLYQGDFEVYAVEVYNMEEALSLASLSFVDKLELMPTYVPSSSSAFYPPVVQLEGSVAFYDLPIVAIVDTGIDPNSPLEQLVVRREKYVPPSYYNPTHGTAVAALVAASDGIVTNPLVPRCRLLDISIVPNNDPKFGETSKLEEDMLIQALEDLVRAYHSDVKYWNLSLSSAPGNQPNAFSGLATHLDDLHKKYGVTFVCAAGNIPFECLRTQWPPDPNNSNELWISSPGDNVCGITVGSCTDEDTPDDALAPKGALSPFSPRGPVTNGVIKPDLVEVGGNITSDKKTELGVRTITTTGEALSICGTSFSTPRVCGVGTEINACIEQSSADYSKSHLLTKALMLHHANMPAVFALDNNMQMSDYYGFGKPSSLQNTLGDQFWRSTTLISGQIYPNGEDIVIDDFPFPDDLCTDKRSFGYTWVTMASDPLLDSSFQREYVRSNVDVHFGTVYNGKFTGQTRSIHTSVNGTEMLLIREEHKWSPVKQYRSPSRMNCLGNIWRLRISLSLREKEQMRIKKGANPYDYAVNFVVAVTIVDPLHAAQVNNQVFQKWRMRGYVPSQIEVMPRLKARFVTNSVGIQ